MLSIQEKYNGQFYTSVKTTGIFSLAYCLAKKSFKKDVIFYDSINEVISNGFRACKVYR